MSKKLYFFTLMFLALAFGSLNAAPEITLDGDGTEASPYLIKTKQDLINLSQWTYVADMSGYGNFLRTTGKYFKLANDIDLEYSEDFKGIGVTAISSLANQITFQGVFDGDNHTIHNMRIHAVEWIIAGYANPQTSIQRKSFIGTLGAGGVVKNLRMAADCDIEVYQYAGGIVGYAAANSQIVNCRNYANVAGYGQSIGGIVGFCQGSISDCFNAGNISCSVSQAGGIVGFGAGSVNRCANTGNVSMILDMSSASQKVGFGGIGGRMNFTTCSDNLNTGAVVGYNYVGGISGDIYATVNCINYGMVSSTDTTYCGSIGGQWSGNSFSSEKPSNCVSDAQILPIGLVAWQNFAGFTNATTAELTSGTALEGFSTDLWQFDAGKYPILKQFADEPSLQQARNTVAMIGNGQNALALSSAVTLNAAEGLVWSLNSGSSFSIQGNTLNMPASPNETPDTLIATCAAYNKRIPIIFNGQGGGVTSPFEGEGTAESPYLLKTKEDLIKLSKLTSTEDLQEATSKEQFAGKYFSIVNDIDVEYSDEFPGIAVGSNLHVHNYIKFRGIIDGNGHTLHNMKLGKIFWTVKPEDAADGLGTVDVDASRASAGYYAFVGHLGDGGIIRNLNIAADCKITGYTALGGVVGKMYDGSLVENCRNYADVLGYNSQIGGIAGALTDSAKVVNCYNAGNITTGTIVAGGIAGNNDGTISGCANAGDVTGKHLTTNVPVGEGFFSNIGGIAGLSIGAKAKADNCLNIGTITGEEQVGGIFGSFSMGNSCLNYGIIASEDLALSGNLYGNKASMAGKFPLDMYYDCQINRQRSVSNEDFTFNPGGGADKIPSSIPTPTLDLISGDTLANMPTSIWKYDANMYPTMLRFADEPKLKAGRSIIAVLIYPENANVVNKSILLYPAANLVWSVNDHFLLHDVEGSSNLKARPILDGEGIITATVGDNLMKKVFSVTLLNTTGVNELLGDKDVQSTRYYNLDGSAAIPVASDGKIYIVEIRYTDGTVRVVKMLNR